MKGSDLKVGLEVCLPDTAYRSRDYDHLGKPSNRRAIVLDSRRVWRSVMGPDGYIPRPVGDETGWNPRRAGYALAVETEEWAAVETDHPYKTGRKRWDPIVADARIIMGTWAEHEEAAIIRAERIERGERLEAERRAKAEAWAAEVGGALQVLGVDWTPKTTLDTHVIIPREVLDELVRAVERLEDERRAAVAR